MANWHIEPFDKKLHRREGFHSGKPMLDQYLHHQVSQYDRRSLGKTYVLLDGDDGQIRGYYTLAGSSIAFDQLTKSMSAKLPDHPIPALLIGRFAIDQAFQGQGLGTLLLQDALNQAVFLSGRLGLHFVEVQAIDHDASLFYQHFDFLPLDNPPRHLVLPISTIQQTRK